MLMRFASGMLFGRVMMFQGFWISYGDCGVVSEIVWVWVSIGEYWRVF